MTGATPSTTPGRAPSSAGRRANRSIRASLAPSAGISTTATGGSRSATAATAASGWAGAPRPRPALRAPPMPARLLVTGARGQLGRELVARAPRRGLAVVALPHGELDIRDRQATALALAAHRPDVVVNA